MFSETWPRWGMMRNGACWEHVTRVHRTSENGSGLWPTITVCGNYNREGLSATSGNGLATVVKNPKLWPTPTKQDAHNNAGPSQMERNTKPLNAEGGGALNPDWVEWLMGWPIGWTDLRGLAMDRFQRWCGLHGKF